MTSLPRAFDRWEHFRVSTRQLRGCSVLASCLLLGCTDFRLEGFLSQPMSVELPSMTPLVELSFRQDGAESYEPPIAALVDSSSALTVISRGGSASRERGRLRVREKVPESRRAAVGQDVVTRFVMDGVHVVNLPVEPVGLAPDAVAIGGVLGADILARFSVSLVYRPTTSTTGPFGSLTLLDEKSGTSEELAVDCNLCDLLQEGGFARQRCDAVLPTTRRGGGDIIVAGEELAIAPTRLVVPVCALPDDFDPNAAATQPTDRGTPMSALVATGLGVSVMARSAFERLRLQDPELELEDGHTLLLASGQEPAALLRLARIALISDEREDERLGACEELARRRRLLVGRPEPADRSEAAAAFAFAGDPAEGILFAVIADESPIFQGLRQELRPTVADVDLLLGGTVLRFFELDLDYPARRIVLRCVDDVAGADCHTVPQCIEGGRPPCSDARWLNGEAC